MKRLIATTFIPVLCLQMLSARVVRGLNNNRVVVQNRSANVNRNANLNRNANANVNRNVNVNQNVNVNRNVNVSGGGYYRGGYYYAPDNNWNAGSFAAGAAVGVATTAVVAAATRPSTTTVVTTPAAVAVGTIVPSLPGGCATVSAGGAMVYNCSNVYYRPFYQGTALVYQVVTYP